MLLVNEIREQRARIEEGLKKKKYRRFKLFRPNY